ncbi:unnamed protein product [Sphenostylis stenocarpa]|uniref:Uncharacterized protein n=1 Tax=Sphenostylis stenocarpa TaxID=92480 RepID=A0AA86W088_9FABA|nr:unnamed protein product [Sphenostylis stenocarpa]
MVIKLIFGDSIQSGYGYRKRGCVAVLEETVIADNWHMAKWGKNDDAGDIGMGPFFKLFLHAVQDTCANSINTNSLSSVESN